MSYHLRIHKSRNLRKYQQAAMPGEIPQKAQTAHRKEAQTAHRKEVQTAHRKEAQTAHRKKTGKHMAFRSLRRPVFYVITGRALRGHAASLLSRSGQLTSVSP